MRSIIILSCSTGEGHNSCAHAIREQLELKGVDCRVCDAIGFIAPWLAALVAWGHGFVYRRLPALFSWGYRYCEEHPAVFEPGSFLYWLLSLGVARLNAALLEGGYDTIICTHVFSGLMVTQLRNKYGCPMKTALVTTDYTCHPGTQFCEMDRYFIADESLRDAQSAQGVACERIVVSGIPVRRAFFTQRAPEEAKAALGISRGSRHLLMMCGSMGCGPLRRTLALLARNLPDDVEISIICGRNRRLYRRLTRKYRNDPWIHPVGYTDRISLYMDSAELYLTKPGGISTSEAAIKGLPMVFINAVAGCEEYNRDFFINMQTAS